MLKTIPNYRQLQSKYNTQQQYKNDLNLLHYKVKKKKKKITFSSSNNNIINNKIMTNNLNKYDRFINWLHQNNSYISNINIKEYSSNHRGLITTKDIQANDILIAIPLKLLITIDKIKQNSIIYQTLIYKNSYIKSKQCFMAIFLLECQYYIKYPNKKSNNIDYNFWKCYLDILPKDLPHLPMNLSKDILRYLDASPLLIQIKERIKRYELDYNEIIKQCTLFKDIATKEQFIYVRQLVQSRIFGYYDANTHTKSSALVPLIDLVNHHMNSNSIWSYETLYSFESESPQVVYNDAPEDGEEALFSEEEEALFSAEEEEEEALFSEEEEEEEVLFSEEEEQQDIEEEEKIIDSCSYFVLIAKRNLKKGEEIFDSYGNRGHSNYFLDYGLVFEENQNFVVSLDNLNKQGYYELTMNYAHNTAVFDYLRHHNPLQHELIQYKQHYLAATYEFDSAEDDFYTSEEEEEDHEEEEEEEVYFKPSFVPLSHQQPHHQQQQQPLQVIKEVSTSTSSQTLLNEFYMLYQLRIICINNLNQYISSIADDLLLLQQQDKLYESISYNTLQNNKFLQKSINQRNCILIRYGEKNLSILDTFY